MKDYDMITMRKSSFKEQWIGSERDRKQEVAVGKWGSEQTATHFSLFLASKCPKHLLIIHMLIQKITIMKRHTEMLLHRNSGLTFDIIVLWAINYKVE